MFWYFFPYSAKHEFTDKENYYMKKILYWDNSDTFSNISTHLRKKLSELQKFITCQSITKALEWHANDIFGLKLND